MAMCAAVCSYLMSVVAPHFVLRLALVNDGASPSRTTMSQPMRARAEVRMKQVHPRILRFTILMR